MALQNNILLLSIAEYIAQGVIAIGNIQMVKKKASL